MDIRNVGGGDPVADWSQLERDVEQLAKDAGTQNLAHDVAQVYVDWFQLDGDLADAGKLTPEYKALENQFVNSMANLVQVCRDPNSSQEQIANALGGVKQILVSILTYIQKP